MAEVSLQDLIRDMAKRIDALDQVVAKNNKDKSNSYDGLTEIDAYIGLDPVLGDLQRQYLEAKSQYKSLVELRGRDDPMAEAAGDWLDSADCAVQTRMIELRRNREIREQAGIIMQQRTVLEVHERRKSVSHNHRGRVEEFERQRRLKAEAARKEGEDGYFAMIFLLWMLQSVTARVRYSLSLADSFRRVVTSEEDDYKALCGN